MSEQGSMFTPSLPTQPAQENDQESGMGNEAQQRQPEGEEDAAPPAQDQQVNELVRSRLLTISEASGTADAGEEAKRPQTTGDESETFRRNLMSVSYLEVQKEA